MAAARKVAGQALGKLGLRVLVMLLLRVLFIKGAPVASDFAEAICSVDKGPIGKAGL